MIALCSLVVLPACGAARQRQAEEHLRNEFNFVVPYVDIDEEDKATRRVLGQRNLVIDDELRGENFSALSASSVDQKRSAVRIITRRGVVAAEDADMDDWFALAKVRLVSVASRSSIPETLVGIVKTARGDDAGCLTLFRVLGDGRVVEAQLHVERFGSRACVNGIEATAPGTFSATVAWPSLSAGVAPVLRVALRVAAERLDQPVNQVLVLSVVGDGDWIASAAEELGSAGSQATFATRQAHAVAQAALSLARNEGPAQQVGAYRSALRGATPGSPEADLMAETVAHIEHGWSEAEPDPNEPAADDEVILPPTANPDEPPDADAIIIEPKALPHD